MLLHEADLARKVKASIELMFGLCFLKLRPHVVRALYHELHCRYSTYCHNISSTFAKVIEELKVYDCKELVVVQPLEDIDGRSVALFFGAGFTWNSTWPLDVCVKIVVKYYMFKRSLGYFQMEACAVTKG